VAQAQRRIDQRILEAAEHDAIVAHMITHDAPLNRRTWMELNYGSDVPKPNSVETTGFVPFAPTIWLGLPQR
jgi:hypothetical protein